MLNLNLICIYCGKEIINEKRLNGDKDYSKVYKSSEHIIQNALGGKLESENICCDRCNFHIEELIDKKFCDIFAPITSCIKNFKKTNNSNSLSKYSGYGIYNKDYENKIVHAEIIKQSQAKKSQDIIEIEKKESTNNLDERIKSALKNTKILFSDFNLNNKYFKQGLSKIAYNYAIYLGINIKDICGICKTKLEGPNKELSDIEFRTPIIPFYANNELDEFIELNSDFFLFHNLILFSYTNQLWCYINLFNTFQFYVILNENYNKEKCRYKIYGEEFQYIQSNIKYDYTNYEDVVIQKAKKYLDLNGNEDISYNFYIKNNIVNKFFRIETPIEYFGNGIYKFILYPLWIIQAYDKQIIDISNYTTEKFKQLNRYLLR